jgi:hypothetical protein
LIAADGRNGALSRLIHKKQTMLERSLSLLVGDLFIGSGVLMTLFGLHFALFSLPLLIWLTLLSAPMIYSWSRQQWLACAFTVISFAISALIGLQFHGLVALISIYSFLLFVGLFLDWSLKLRPTTQK